MVKSRKNKSKYRLNKNRLSKRKKSILKGGGGEIKKITYDDGSVYEGEYNDDKKNGTGKYTDINGDVYEGEYKDDKKHGIGNMTYFNSGVYEGEWRDDMKNGRGKYTVGNRVYEGEWRDDRKNGTGTYTDPDGSVYEGEWQDNEKNGRGKYTDPDGGVYEGEWNDDDKNGMGKMSFPDGGVYEGEWENDEKNGRGKYTDPDGRVYEGEWENDEKNGRGTTIFPDGSIHKGKYINGLAHGKGKYLMIKTGNIYDGEFLSGAMTGKGKLYLRDGPVYEGEWKDGRENGKGKLIQKDGNVKEYSFKDGRSYNFDNDIDKYILTNYEPRKADESKYITILINLHGSDLTNSFCQLGSNKHVRCITPVMCGISNYGNFESVINAFQIAYNVSHLNDRNASTHDKIKKIIEIFNQDNPSYYGKNSFHRPMIDHTYSVIDPSDMFKEIFIIDTNHNTVLFEDMNYNLFDKKIDKLETITDIENYNILPKLLPFLTLNEQNLFLRSNLINVLLELGYDNINMIDLSCRDIDKRILPDDKNNTKGRHYQCDYRENIDQATFLGDAVTSFHL